MQNYIEIGPVVSDKKIFKSFLYRLYRENKPCPLAAMFFDESKCLEQSWYRITKGTFLQNYIEIGPVVSDKKIFKSFLYRYIGKISPAPWWPCFLTNPNGLNNLGTGSPKEHFCKIILKSVQQFRTRRFLKVFYIHYIGKISPVPLAAMFFDESKCLEQSWYRITKGTCLQNYIEIGRVVSDKKIFKVFYIDI